MHVWFPALPWIELASFSVPSRAAINPQLDHVTIDVDRVNEFLHLHRLPDIKSPTAPSEAVDHAI